MGGREAAIIPFLGEGRLLDVGCAGGKDLARLQRMGWNVTGVEFSPTAAAAARARLGCEVLVGDFDQVPLGEERFDVVRFSHTLEHLPSPRKALEKAHRLLRPGGLLCVEVPNAASLERWLFGKHWYCWDLPRHLYHFSPQTLARLVSSTGFRPVKIKCDGRTLFFTESLANVWKHWLGASRQPTKLLSVLARPVVYAMGAMNQGGILTVHARKNRPGADGSPGGRVFGRSDGTTP
jgi:SAM-dependent methyltransferase